MALAIKKILKKGFRMYFRHRIVEMLSASIRIQKFRAVEDSTRVLFLQKYPADFPSWAFWNLPL